MLFYIFMCVNNCFGLVASTCQVTDSSDDVFNASRRLSPQRPQVDECVFLYFLFCLVM